MLRFTNWKKTNKEVFTIGQDMHFTIAFSSSSTSAERNSLSETDMFYV